MTKVCHYCESEIESENPTIIKHQVVIDGETVTLYACDDCAELRGHTGDSERARQRFLELWKAYTQ